MLKLVKFNRLKSDAKYAAQNSDETSTDSSQTSLQPIKIMLCLSRHAAVSSQYPPVAALSTLQFAIVWFVLVRLTNRQ